MFFKTKRVKTYFKKHDSFWPRTKELYIEIPSLSFIIIDYISQDTIEKHNLICYKLICLKSYSFIRSFSLIFSDPSKKKNYREFQNNFQIKYRLKKILYSIVFKNGKIGTSHSRGDTRSAGMCVNVV